MPILRGGSRNVRVWATLYKITADSATCNYFKGLTVKASCNPVTVIAGAPH